MWFGVNIIPINIVLRLETWEFFLCFQPQFDKIGINRESEYSTLFRYRNSVDLIFYNRLLRCFVVIEIKTKKITHQDLGQLQMYVNYYDRYEKLPDENPTVGILLCAAKNDTLVKITLPEDNTSILTSQYQLYLPSEESLLDEIKDVLELAEGGGVDG